MTEKFIILKIENYKIELETVNFSELIYRSLAAYRQYCKHDILIMEKLAKMLKYLLNHPCENERYADTIKKQLHILYEDCQTNIENKSDIERLRKYLKVLYKIVSNSFQISFQNSSNLDY
ncbi:MAG: hypothetical protein R2728_01945 [Chitinophagales bacterium]